MRTQRSVPTPSSPSFGYVVPDSEMICGPFSALSETFSVPVKVPFAVGANLTVIAHVPLGCTVSPEQVVLAENGAFTPLIAGFEKISGVVPVFLTVIDTVLLLFFVVVGKVSLPWLKPVALKLATGLMT